MTKTADLQTSDQYKVISFNEIEAYFDLRARGVPKRRFPQDFLADCSELI
jgi:hypothetical protein